MPLQCGNVGEFPAKNASLSAQRAMEEIVAVLDVTVITGSYIIRLFFSI